MPPLSAELCLSSHVACKMAGTPSPADEFALICEGLFEPWDVARPEARQAASALADKAAIGKVLPAAPKWQPSPKMPAFAIGMPAWKRCKLVDECDSASVGDDWRFWDKDRQLCIARAIAAAPWRRPSPYLVSSASSTSDSHK
jgi:hypothetical protein